MNIKKYIAELKKRNVFKVAITYGITAWILLQIVETVVPIINAPKWLLKIVLILLIIGFPIALIFAWAFELTPEGLKKTKYIDETFKNKRNKYSNVIFIALVIVLVFFISKPWWYTNQDGVEPDNSIENTDSTKASIELTSNIEALDYFLKGEFYHNKESELGIDSAIVYYNKAIGLDPKFAKAYNNLGDAYMRKYLFFDPDTKWEQEAYTAAGKALLIDSNLANPHLIKGQFYWSESHNFSHEEALAEFIKAIEKDPKLSEAYEKLAMVQIHIGLLTEGHKNALKSLQLDAGNYEARRFSGEALLFQGKYNDAMKEFEKIPDKLSTNHARSLKALNFFYLNQMDKAMDILNTNLKIDPYNPNLNSVYAIILAKKGHHTEATQKKELALEYSKEFIHAHHVYFHLGITASLMNDRKEAVIWLRKSAETGFPNYPLFNDDPNLKNLKGDPDFDELLNGLRERYDHFQNL